MKFDALQQRVRRAERLVEGRAGQARDDWHEIGAAWRGLWTPWRIVGAGVVAGFLSGRAEPLAFAGRLGSVRWMEILTTVSSFATEITAAGAAAQAGSGAVADAGDGDGARSAGAAATPGPAPATAEPRAPAPAEAATDLSAS